jgi:hypothetical protein
MAQRTTLEAEKPPKPAKSGNKSAAAPLRPAAAGEPAATRPAERDRILEAFRRWGYLESTLDPIGLFTPQPSPELAFTGPLAD